MSESPASLRHIPALDSVRAVAALGVFTSHYVQQFLSIPSLGWTGKALELLGVAGVAVFFVLSGFLIHSGTLLEVRRTGEIDWRAYGVRRFFRIVPPLYVALVLCAWVAVHWQSNMIEPTDMWGLISHLLLISSFIPGEFESINAVFWTVIVECHFYAAYPLLWWMARKWSFLTIAFGTLVFGMLYFVVASAAVPPGPVRVMLQHTVPALFWKWCLGVVLAEMWVNGRLPWLRSLLHVKWSLPVGLLAVFGGTFSSDDAIALQYKRFILPFGAFLLVGVFVFSGFSKFRSRFLEWSGLISYSIYLWHPVALLLALSLAEGRPGIALFIGLAGTYGMSAIAYYSVERESIAQGRRILLRGRVSGPSEQL